VLQQTTPNHYQRDTTGRSESPRASRCESARADPGKCSTLNSHASL